MPSALAAMVLLLAACGDQAPAPAISTHVEDWRDEVIYEVVVDRFDNGDPANDTAGGAVVQPGVLSRFQGGDWAGLTRRLDYIQDLGMTAIWISPVVDNVVSTEREDGYHGYWASDFTRPNPRFGTLEELRELVRQAHARGLLILFDIVTNHTGRVFSYDLDGDGEVDPGETEPPYSLDGPYDVPLIWHTAEPMLDGLVLDATRFRRRGQGDLRIEEQRIRGDFPTGLRDIDTEQDEVIDAMVDTYARWVQDTDVDGFRIDAVPHVELAFWPRFCTALRERLAAMGKDRFMLLGEVFDGDPEHRAQYTRDGGLDSAFDFNVKLDLVDAVVLDGRAPTIALGALGGYRDIFPSSPHPMGIDLSPWQARVAFGDNHDMWRLRGELDDPRAAELALTAVFTLDAIPAVYYGTEQELSGEGGHSSREVLWETGFCEDTRTFRFIRRLADIRRDHAALRQGSLTVRYAAEEGARDGTAPDAGILAWERELEGERLLVVLATDAFEESTARIPTGFASGATLHDLLVNGTDRWPVRPGGFVELTLQPRQALILAQ